MRIHENSAVLIKTDRQKRMVQGPSSRRRTPIPPVLQSRGAQIVRMSAVICFFFLSASKDMGNSLPLYPKIMPYMEVVYK
jgi:hypothetical protein